MLSLTATNLYYHSGLTTALCMYTYAFPDPQVHALHGARATINSDLDLHMTSGQCHSARAALSRTSTQSGRSRSSLTPSPSTVTMGSDNLPLPDGWIREIDPNTKQPFWVCSRLRQDVHHEGATADCLRSSGRHQSETAAFDMGTSVRGRAVSEGAS